MKPAAMALEELRRVLKANEAILRGRFKVKEIGIFGSYARGEQKKSSDLDILVEFDGVPSLLEFVALENYLSEHIGTKVDLVMKRALKPRIGKRILEELVHL